MSLEEKLIAYSESDYYGFHMPGHKRSLELFEKENRIPYEMDITEIDGFDDLHHSEDILLDARKKAAQVFGAKESYYLINGSTVGNIAAIMSVTNKGDKILIARNNHKSVYNAVFLQELQPIYVYPEFNLEYNINGEILATDIEKILETEKGIKAVVIVSPTYEGVISDIQEIANIAHGKGIPLIVDEAHGAHLGMELYFHRNSNAMGADIVVHSVHKTLPSLTQTGLLHVNGSLVDLEKVQRYLRMLQSSSPSYILMASIDKCVKMMEEKGEELFYCYVKNLEKLRSSLQTMKKLKIVETKVYDKSKIVISTKRTNLSGKELYRILLEEYHLQMEMSALDYVIAMTSVGDTEVGLERLEKALLEIDKNIEKIIEENIENSKQYQKDNIQEDVIEQENQWIRQLPHLKHAESGEIGSEWFYYMYPPGIPLVVPGEVITEEIKSLMKHYEEQGFMIYKS